MGNLWKYDLSIRVVQGIPHPRWSSKRKEENSIQRQESKTSKEDQSSIRQKDIDETSKHLVDFKVFSVNKEQLHDDSLFWDVEWII